MPDDVLKLVVHMVLQGLKYLHTECHVIHTDELSSGGYRRVDANETDLKEDNILMALNYQSILNGVAQDETIAPLPQKHVDIDGH